MPRKLWKGRFQLASGSMRSGEHFTGTSRCVRGQQKRGSTHGWRGGGFCLADGALPLGYTQDLGLVHQAAQAGSAECPELEPELADLFVEASCRRPAGKLSDARQQEWEDSLSRSAASKTIQRQAKLARQRVAAFSACSRPKGLNDVDHVDLDAFVSKGTNAPQLRWFSNAGQLGWVLPASAPLRAERVGLLLRHSIHLPYWLGLDGAVASVPVATCGLSVF